MEPGTTEYPKLILSNDTDEHLPRLSGGYPSGGNGDDLGPRILRVGRSPVGFTPSQQATTLGMLADDSGTDARMRYSVR